MREPPAFVGDAEVLEVRFEGWLAGIDGIEYLPVGFGAHHWVALPRPPRDGGTTG